MKSKIRTGIYLLLFSSILILTIRCKKEDDIPSTITDIDGNTYNTVIIGKQAWTVENLKTTKYSDGTSIQLVTDASEWSVLSSDGYCWYDNDINNKNTYGALYNWYGVSAGELCPDGWHVPTDEEWDQLLTYLGGSAGAGGKMKEAGTIHWHSPNTEATDESGFTALPGGYRLNNGIFDNIAKGANFWSSSEDNTSTARVYSTGYNFGNIYRSSTEKKSGFSVRCIRD